MKVFLAFLIASEAAGAVLKDTFLSRDRSQSQALEADSKALDNRIQSYADKLEPGATREFLKTLRLCAPCQKFERIGEAHDGGYVMCMDGLDHGLIGAYSYGINGFDGWGMAVASRFHIPLQEYDCFNLQQPAACSGCSVKFHGECILNQHGQPSYDHKTLTQQLSESGNAQAAKGSLLLKIDVEAAEWSVFAEEPVDNLKKFREIIVEYHWVGDTHKHDLYLAAVKKVEKAGFSVAHLHGNNHQGMINYGEYSIPHVLEVTYIQTPPSGCAANIPYRIPQDQPCAYGSPELPDAHLPSKL